MVNPSQLLRMAGGTAFRTEWHGQYKWHDITNPKYNYFFRDLLLKVNGAALAAGTVYGITLLFTAEPGR